MVLSYDLTTEIFFYKNKSVRTTMRLKWAFWDILGQFGRLFDEFGAFRLFYQSFPTIFSHNRLGHFLTFFDNLGHLETFWDI